MVDLMNQFFLGTRNSKVTFFYNALFTLASLLVLLPSNLTTYFNLLCFNNLHNIWACSMISLLKISIDHHVYIISRCIIIGSRSHFFVLDESMFYRKLSSKWMLVRLKLYLCDFPNVRCCCWLDVSLT